LLIGRIRVRQVVANIRFGGPKNNRLFIAANTTLYSLVMSTTGAGPTSRTAGTTPAVD
jgi:gluconolactonase